MLLVTSQSTPLGRSKNACVTVCNCCYHWHSDCQCTLALRLYVYMYMYDRILLTLECIPTPAA